MDTTALQHVLIIGCGFGGLEAAKALRHANVRVTVVDRSNHHLFQPLLYQVATAGLAAPAIAAPIRHIFRNQHNVTTLLAEATSIDANARTVTLLMPDGVTQTIAYDHLIVAAGATHSYFGNDAWAAHAGGLKTLEDAMTLRRRILNAFESAESEQQSDVRAALQTFVVIGAGPTGVEMAGTMAEIARHTLRGEFRRIDPARSRVILIEGGSRVLSAMPEPLSDKARKQLEHLGVEVMLNARVTQVHSDGVVIRCGETDLVLASRTVVWAAGVAASPLGAVLHASTACVLDRAGRVKVQPDLSLAHFPSISVIGDMAAAESHHNGTVIAVPGVSPAAKQMGRCAANNLLRRLRSETTIPFRYRDYGNLATIGRNAAVVDLATPLGAFRMSGYLAWLFWLFAHVYFLIGFRNRFVVLLDWASAYLTFSRHARVVIEPVRNASAPSSRP